jgi:hypothetical protein
MVLITAASHTGVDSEDQSIAIARFTVEYIVRRATRQAHGRKTTSIYSLAREMTRGYL